MDFQEKKVNENHPLPEKKLQKIRFLPFLPYLLLDGT